MLAPRVAEARGIAPTMKLNPSSVHQRALCHHIGQLKVHVVGDVKLNREILFRNLGLCQGAVGHPDGCLHDLSFLSFLFRPDAGYLTVMKNRVKIRFGVV